MTPPIALPKLVPNSYPRCLLTDCGRSPHRDGGHEPRDTTAPVPRPVKPRRAPGGRGADLRYRAMLPGFAPLPA